MHGEQQVVLTFGEARIEHSFTGSFETLALEVDAEFGLQPQTYGLFDACGRVETPAALQRAIHTAGGAACVLEVREHAHWGRMREMESQIRALKAREPVVDAAIQALEDRVLEKVRAALSGLGGNYTPVDVQSGGAVAPLLGTPSPKHEDRKANPGQQASGASGQAVDALTTLQAPVNSDRVASASNIRDQLADRDAHVCKGLEELRQHLKREMDSVLGENRSLRSDLQDVHSCAKTAQDKLAALQTEVCSLSDRLSQTAGKRRWQVTGPTRDQAQPKYVASDAGTEEYPTEPFAGVPYSRKRHPGGAKLGAQLGNGGTLELPGAQRGGLRLDRAHGYCSLPQLPNAQGGLLA